MGINIRNRYLPAFVSMFSCLVPLESTLAQSTPVEPITMDSAQRAAAQEDIRGTAAAVTAGGSSASATFGNLASAIQIETTSDAANAVLAFNIDRSHPVGSARRLENGASRFTFATDTLSFIASAPLGKGGQPSRFDFDRLGDGTSLQVGLARYWGSVDYFPAADVNSLPALQSRLENRCVDAASGVWVSKQANEVEARGTADALRIQIDKLKQSRGAGPAFALSEAKKSTDAKVAALAVIIEVQCVTEVEGKTLLERYGDTEDKEVHRASRPSGLWVLGGSAKVSRTSYDYLTESPLANASISRTGYKFETFVGRIFGSGRVSTIGSFSYGRSLKPGDPVQRCEPNGIGTQLGCFTGPIGPPTETNRYTLSGEIRYFLPVSGVPAMPGIGFAPRVSYEVRSKGALFELPVFFASSKAGALNGGLRAAYNTSDRDFVFGLFVGVPFSIFYQ
jgi:hypothetical protein